MPNWTSNTITRPKDIIKPLLDKENNFDFNKIIKMPEELNLESGSITEQAVLAYLTNKTLDAKNVIGDDKIILDALVHNQFCEDMPWAEKLASRMQELNSEKIDELFDLGKRYVDNYKTFGAATWYNWCWENWGTKWNACETEIVDKNSKTMTVRFLTAWNFPYKIFEKICADNQNAEIEFVYENEDYDGTHYLSNAGGFLMEDDVIFIKKMV